MKRRRFLGWFSFGWVAGLLPFTLASCSPPETAQQTPSPASPVPPAAPPSDVSDGFQQVGSLSEVRSNFMDDGPTILDDSPVGPVALVPDYRQPDDVIALNPTCPHKGCVVDWDFDEEMFVCPCHDSMFTMDGTVREGPAQANLTRYQAKVENGTIFVQG